MTIDPLPGDVTLHTIDEVETALSNPSLVPPPAPVTLRPGPTANLRAAMARFSAGDDHGERRDAVVAAIARLDPHIVARLASDETGSLLAGGGRVDAIADIAFIAPTRALAKAIKPAIEISALDQIVADVATMVSVIGRGLPSSPQSDAAVTRLFECFCHPADDRDSAVAVLSLLYQNHDATAALIASILVAKTTGNPQRSPLAKTVRVAKQHTMIGERAIEPRQVVIVPIDSPGNWFGSGPHKCPGQDLAETMASAVVDGIAGSGYRIITQEITFGADGRATTIPIETLAEQDGDQP